jgi:hypothetical protein
VVLAVPGQLRPTQRLAVADLPPVHELRPGDEDRHQVGIELGFLLLELLGDGAALLPQPCGQRLVALLGLTAAERPSKGRY